MLAVSAWALTVFCWWRHNIFFYVISYLFTGLVIHTGRRSMHFLFTMDIMCILNMWVTVSWSHGYILFVLTHMLYVVTALCGCWIVLLTWTGRATGRITFDECEMFWCVSVVGIWKESRSEKTTGCLVDYQRILHALRDAGTKISVALADSWCRFIFFWACCSLVNSSERFFA